MTGAPVYASLACRRLQQHDRCPEMLGGVPATCVCTCHSRAGAQAAPWPEPEVACRDAEPGETPAGARRLADLACDHGWGVRVTYARGSVPVGRAGSGKGKVVDSVAVRLRRGSLRVAAVWEDGGFCTCVVRYDAPPVRMFRVMGARQATALVGAQA